MIDAEGVQRTLREERILAFEVSFPNHLLDHFQDIAKSFFALAQQFLDLLALRDVLDGAV